MLDSPAPVDGLDGYDQLRTLGTPRVLREVCFPGPLPSRPCPTPTRRSPPPPSGCRAARCAGRSCCRSGRVQTARVTECDLYAALAAERPDPGAARRPAGRDRLARRGRRRAAAAPRALLGAAAPATGDVNARRLLATSCIEGRLPWAPDSPVASRADALKAFVAERAAELRAVQRPDRARSSSAAALCAELAADAAARARRLPRPGRPRARASPAATTCARRWRTPAAPRAQYPNAKVLAVPGVGHSVLSSDPSGCARERAGRLPARPRGRGAARARGSASLRPRPYAPATTRTALRPTRLAGPARAHAQRGHGHAHRARLRRAATHDGERSGSPACAAATCAGRARRSSCTSVEWIRGVRVSGRLDRRGRGTLVVSGPAAAPGTVTYTRARRERRPRRPAVQPVADGRLTRIGGISVPGGAGLHDTVAVMSATLPAPQHIDRDRVAALMERERARLHERTARSGEYFARASAVMPGGVPRSSSATTRGRPTSSAAPARACGTSTATSTSTSTTASA